MLQARYPLFEVTATSAELVTPSMKRITIDATSIAPFIRGQPTEWLKVFVPGSDTGRAYTIRRFERATGRLDLDFVLHGDHGTVSAWAARATVGARFQISQPHPRSGFVWPSGIEDHLIFGDETALPAIGSLLESLTASERADVFIAINDPRAVQQLHSAARVSLTWLDGDLATAAAQAPLPSRDFDVWAAGEAASIKNLRDHFRRLGVATNLIHAAGYWKNGAPDFRDDQDGNGYRESRAHGVG